MSSKNRSKQSNQSSSARNPSVEHVRIPVFRSRSIDSMSTGDHHTEEEIPYDKPPSSATFAKTFRILRKRLSRTPNALKQKSTQNANDQSGKSGGDDSEGSSVGEEGGHFTFNEIPASNPDLATVDNSTGVSLKVHRSLPGDRTPEIITSSPPETEFYEKNNGNETNNLSKTWSSSTFTGAQLRGTCSIEYTEHMKEKSHKRKAHMIDLRKDDVQHQQQLTTTSSLSTSKHTISTSFTSYHSHILTHLNIKGALAKYSINLVFLFIFN